MNFETSRAKAVEKLDRFIEKNLSEYSRLRNFDFGPNKRDNISCLSPYITHGVLNEVEVIKKSLAKYSFNKNEIAFIIYDIFASGLLHHNLISNYKNSQNFISLPTSFLFDSNIQLLNDLFIVLYSFKKTIIHSNKRFIRKCSD